MGISACASGVAPHGPHNPPGDYDYTRFINGVQKHFPKTTFFLAWHYKWSLGRNRNAKQLLEHPWLVNRADLPEWAMSGPVRPLPSDRG
jgi:hypothetical protein